MIDLYFAPTPNGWKITILLEELGADYRIVPVHLVSGEQYEPQFLRISPNNKIPAIVDRRGDGEPLALFESGAILLYLAEQHGRFLPTDMAGRWSTIEWVMWQMSGLGPMLGQHGHFLLYAEERVPYALDRFRNEARRLYGVLDRQLAATGAYVAGADYGIADMACFPWVMTHKAQQFELAAFPHVQRWYAELRERPALQRGLAVGRAERAASEEMTPQMRRKFFGLSAAPDREGEASGPQAG